jgi:hypothetical protein
MIDEHNLIPILAAECAPSAYQISAESKMYVRGADG